MCVRLCVPCDVQEQSIVPSDAHLFPDYDWLLGNHSDELTPWIPMMAARWAISVPFNHLPLPSPLLATPLSTTCHTPFHHLPLPLQPPATPLSTTCHVPLHHLPRPTPPPATPLSTTCHAPLHHLCHRSSYRTKFFVLPCCPHDFVGRVSTQPPHPLPVPDTPPLPSPSRL